MSRFAGRIARGSVHSLVALVTLAAFIAPLASLSTASAANASANLDQCRNGPVDNPLRCLGDGSGSFGWVNGNAGASNAHWKEGESIAYRTRLDNLDTGIDHQMTIQWDTTKSGKHAIDYITSWDRSVLPGSNACDTVCDGTVPNLFDIPTDFQVTSRGVTEVPQGERQIACYGCTITSLTAPTLPGGVSNGAFTLTGDYSSDSSTATTINFTTAVVNPVIAWGGHIASQVDWGEGNSAATISGSPYHMRILELDGVGGNQDRSLASAAIIVPKTPTVVTDILDAQGNVITSAPIGSSVHDRATVSGSAGTPTGTVTFSLFLNQDCSGTASSTQTVSLDGSGQALSSSTTVPNTGLSYQAAYSGDTTYAPGTSACEPLTPEKLTPDVATDILDAQGNVITSAPIGSEVHDRATVSGSAGTPTGSVTFSLFLNQDCSGTASSTETVSLDGSGQALSSPTTVPNTGLSYQATYNPEGDPNYGPATSPCEPLTPEKLTPDVATDILDAQGNVITSAPIGSEVHDRATVSGSVGTPTGSVDFSLFTNQDCSGTASSVENVALDANGQAESSATTVPNTGLSYQATYGGDATYTGATSPCEPLAPEKLTPTVLTDVLDANGNSITSADVGASVHDLAIVSGSVGTPTGTVTFSLFDNKDCSGTAVSTEDVVLDASGQALSSSTTVPKSGLSYQATYGGDENYVPATSPCEPLKANKIPVGPPQTGGGGTAFPAGLILIMLASLAAAGALRLGRRARA